MKVLSLIIKQAYFDEIRAGRKDFEERELRPRSETRYIRYDEKGHIHPIEYDAIRFYAGYRKDRDEMLVKITDVEFIHIVDENDEPFSLRISMVQNMTCW